jgi:hypothetical protein
MKVTKNKNMYSKNVNVRCNNLLLNFYHYENRIPKNRWTQKKKKTIPFISRFDMDRLIPAQHTFCVHYQLEIIFVTSSEKLSWSLL